MNIREFRGILVQLQRLYGAGGAKGAEKDLSTIAMALEPHELKSVKEFVAEVQDKLAAHGAANTSSSTKVDRGNAERRVERLVEAGTDKQTFYKILQELKDDKAIKIADADVIARAYTGFKTKYKKKQAAFDDIEKVFIERARFENKINSPS